MSCRQNYVMTLLVFGYSFRHNSMNIRRNTFKFSYGKVTTYSIIILNYHLILNSFLSHLILFTVKYYMNIIRAHWIANQPLYQQHPTVSLRLLLMMTSTHATCSPSQGMFFTAAKSLWALRVFTRECTILWYVHTYIHAYIHTCTLKSSRLITCNVYTQTFNITTNNIFACNTK